MRARDRRWQALAVTFAAVVLGGAWIARLESPHAPQTLEVPSIADGSPEQVQVRFDAAVVLLQARRYEAAATASRRLLEVAPHMPEAHVNLGFALLELGQAATARRHFERAMQLNPRQANAYYGVALAHEAAGDLELALGAMRSYLHLVREVDAVHLRRARAALWEWESRLAAQRKAAPVGAGTPRRAGVAADLLAPTRQGE